MITILEYAVLIIIALGTILLVALGKVGWSDAASLLSLVLGYAVGVMRNTVTGNPTKPLP